MFEQSLYNQEAFAPTPESHEGDLFYNYEFKNWNFSPRLYKILASAVVLDLLFLVVIAQADLTKKGCDTFLTSTVCQVIDTAYVANALFGTKREYVDAVYEKTELKDADITFVNVDDAEPPFYYPGCYFPEATPVQCGVPDTRNPSPGYIAPGLPIPNLSGQNSLLAQKAHPPKSNPNAVEGPIPSSPLGDSTDDSSVASTQKNPGSKKFPGSKNGNGQPETSPNLLPSLIPNSTATNRPQPNPAENKIDPITGGAYNNRPWKNLGSLVNDLLVKKEFNLDSNFTVRAKAKLGKDGKIDTKTFKYLKAESSDKKILQVVQESILAFNDSGRLQILNDLTGKDLDLTLSQDDQSVSAIVQTEVDSVESANSIKSGLNVLKALAISAKNSPNADLNDKDDLLLLNNVKIETDGKNLIIKFMINKPDAQQMIRRKLDDLAKEPKQSNDTIGPNSSLNTAANR